jgi:NFU1 iron-sulfur cluster scaffold homolog, mitochondrial
MLIHTESTPNPETLKFLPDGVTLLPTGTAYFADIKETAASPLAARLFALNGVAAVFLGSDFVTVRKKTDAAWDYLQTQVMAALVDHLQSGLPVIHAPQASGAGQADDDTPVIKEIKALLESHVRPAVAQDGGDIIFNRFEDGILYLEMQGACSGCPSSTATLKSGIENMMRHYVPEVLEVRAA